MELENPRKTCFKTYITPTDMVRRVLRWERQKRCCSGKKRSGAHDREMLLVEIDGLSTYRHILSPHMLVLATSERRVPTLVATNGSH